MTVRNSGRRLCRALQGILAEVELLQEITEATRAAVQAFVVDRCDKDGIITNKALTNFARLAGLGKQPYLVALEVSPRPCALCPGGPGGLSQILYIMP